MPHRSEINRRDESPRSRSARWTAAACLFLYIVSIVGLPIPSEVARNAATPEAARPEAAASAPLMAACGCPLDAAARGNCCCSKAGGRACCSQPAPAKEPEPAAPTARSAPAVTWVVAIAAAQCQGLSDTWLCCSDEGIPLAAAIQAPRCDRVAAIATCEPLAPPLERDPPVPPPRLLG